MSKTKPPKDYRPDMIRDLKCALESMANVKEELVGDLYSFLTTAEFQVAGVLRYLEER